MKKVQFLKKTVSSYHKQSAKPPGSNSSPRLRFVLEPRCTNFFVKSEHFHARGPSSRALARRELSTSVSQHPNSRPTDTLKNEIAGLNRITEKITSLVHKTYTFEEFNDIAAASGWMGEFGAYEF